jgi:hypothetical protein
VDKDNGNSKTTEDSSIDELKSDNTSKDIKKGMDRYEAKIRSGEAAAGDATSSDE